MSKKDFRADTLFFWNFYQNFFYFVKLQFLFVSKHQNVKWGLLRDRNQFKFTFLEAF